MRTLYIYVLISILRVPYEKGFLLLLQLEQLVGGKDKMIDWLRKVHLGDIAESRNLIIILSISLTSRARALILIRWLPILLRSSPT